MTDSGVIQVERSVPLRQKEDIKAEVIYRRNWTGSETVRAIQNGALCKGLYVTNSIEELDREREEVLCIVDDIEFKGPLSAHETVHKVFQSENLAQSFEQHFGKSSSLLKGSVGLGIREFSIGFSGKLSSDKGNVQLGEKTEITHEKYVASSHCERVPVKSVQLTERNIKLRPEVIQDLQSIERNLKQVRYQSKGQFRNFFKKYGTHVIYGVVDLGGIVISTASCSGFKEDQRGRMNEIASAVSKASAEGGFAFSTVGAQADVPFNASDLHLQTSQNFTEDELKEISLMVRKIGGPDEANNREDWMKGLSENNSLLRIVHTSSNPKPIWELLSNYRDSFDSHILLSHAMEEEWRKVVSSEPTARRRIDSLRRDIKIWLELNRDEEKLENAVKSLSIIRYRNDIMDEDWRDEVLYSPEVQKILIKAANYMKSTTDSYTLRQLMTYLQNILHPQSRIDIERFAGVEDIIKELTDPKDNTVLRLLQMKNISDLPRVLAEILQGTDWTTPGYESKLRRLQQRLEYTVKIWSACSTGSYSYLVTIGVLRLFGFALKSSQFEYLLTKDDFDQICSTLAEYLHGMNDIDSEEKKQAYVINLALTCAVDREIAVSTMIEGMPNGLSKQLQVAYRDAFKDDGSCNLRQFQEKVLRCLDDKQEKVDLKAVVRSIKTQLHFIQARNVNVNWTELEAFICEDEEHNAPLAENEETMRQEEELTPLSQKNEERKKGEGVNSPGEESVARNADETTSHLQNEHEDAAEIFFDAEEETSYSQGEKENEEEMFHDAPEESTESAGEEILTRKGEIPQHGDDKDHSGFAEADVQEEVATLEEQEKSIKPETATDYTGDGAYADFLTEKPLDSDVEKLIEALGMSHYYPQKLKYEDLIMLTPDVHDDFNKKPKTLSQLPWYFMKHIIGLDSDTRENCHLDSVEEDTVASEEHDSESEDEDDFSDDYSDDDDQQLEESTKEGMIAEAEENIAEIHPLDLIYAVYLCADDFLRQELSDKMMKCLFAVPLILPLPRKIRSDKKFLMLHWALRSITRSFHCNGKVENGTLIDVQAPLVTCVSMDKETSWKSRLMNKVLSPQQQTFWNQGLKGGDCEQRISQGMVELAWYLPGGRGDDIFSQPVAFANVRGSSGHREAAGDKLLNASSVSCLFTQKVDKALTVYLKENAKFLRNMVLVVLHETGDESAMEQRCQRLRKRFKLEKHQIIRRPAEDRYFSKVYEQLKISIDHLMSQKGHSVSISEFVIDTTEDGRMDVDNRRCHYGQTAAERILQDIDKINTSAPGSAKAEVLPCQSDTTCRRDIAALDKELCRQRKWSRDIAVPLYTASVKESKWKLQLQQLLQPISPTYAYFLQCLINLGTEDRKYFLQCLKLGLNERSVQLLEPLYAQYAKCRLEDESEEKDKKLRELDEKLTYGSLGIEHFFREMAVIHDNIAALQEREKSDDLSNTLSLLAGMMADFLAEGTAIEIMDGDAINVPVAWLTAVLNKVENNSTAGLFKVSVLGAQSCGKSTLLNTVFGLNFPVSSGRCTRGAYMQLVRIGGSLKEELQCEYMAVIDSEGLMSRTRSDDSEYDNEISTFIIGLSDLTVVIIKGEGKEMNDVLPLAIHVFLRMNIVGEHQACHFVHQNMGAVDAATKVVTEIDAFVQDLNTKTLAAAEDADQTDKYKKFTDVLHYNSLKDNTYVPGLWNGTPPMAKTNIHYAETMSALKSKIVSTITSMRQDHKKQLSTVEDFGKRLDELWKAVKYENFVFSFKNVLAVEAHKKLSKTLDEQQWEMKRAIRHLIQQEETMIENEVSRGNLRTDLSTMICKSKQRITEQIARKQTKIGETMLHYFNCMGCSKCNENIKNRHLLKDKKHEFEDDIRTLAKSLLKEMESSIERLEVRLNADKRLLELSKEMDGLLKEMVKEAIKDQKTDDLSPEDIESKFDDLWKKETGDILRRIRTTAEKQVKIEAIVSSTIVALLNTNSHLYKRERSRGANPMPYVQFDHMSLKKLLSSRLDAHDQQRLSEKTKTIIEHAKKYYEPHPSSPGREITVKDAEILFQELLKQIKDVKDERFKITDEYKRDLITYIENEAVKGFKLIQQKYLKETSPQAILEKKKKSYKDVFMIKMGQGDAAARFCQNVLKNLILDNVEEQLSCTELLHDLRVHCGEMFRDVKSIQASIMVDLFRKNEFRHYMDYIANYEMFVTRALSFASRAHFYENNRLQKLGEIQLDRIIHLLLEAIDKTVKSTCDDKHFIETFFSNIENLKISQNEVVAFQDLDVPDQHQFAAILHQQLLDEVKKQIIKSIKSWNVAEKLENKGLTDFLFAEIIGCNARCPFCKVPCDTHSGGKSKGNHSATLHRPQGLGGYRNSKSNQLVVTDCTLEITTKTTFRNKDTNQKPQPYKGYHKFYPNWTIHGNAEPNVEKYWKWVFAQYNAQIAEYYSALKAEIPEGWTKYDRNEILKDIEENYYIKVDI